MWAASNLGKGLSTLFSGNTGAKLDNRNCTRSHRPNAVCSRYRDVPKGCFARSELDCLVQQIVAVIQASSLHAHRHRLNQLLMGQAYRVGQQCPAKDPHKQKQCRG